MSISTQNERACLWYHRFFIIPTRRQLVHFTFCFLRLFFVFSFSYWAYFFLFTFVGLLGSTLRCFLLSYPRVSYHLFLIPSRQQNGWPYRWVGNPDDLNGPSSRWPSPLAFSLKTMLFLRILYERSTFFAIRCSKLLAIYWQKVSTQFSLLKVSSKSTYSKIFSSLFLNSHFSYLSPPPLSSAYSVFNSLNRWDLRLTSKCGPPNVCCFLTPICSSHFLLKFWIFYLPIFLISIYC